MKRRLSTSLSKIGPILNNVESIAFGKIPTGNHYIQTKDDGRFLKVSAFKRWNAGSGRAGFENPDLCAYPLNIKEHLRWVKRCFCNSFVLPCNADVILLRANMSLFYLKEGVRIKIGVGNPDRPVHALKTEYELRKRAEQMNFIKVPALLQGRFDDEPFFFMDEVMPGRLLAWKDQETEDVFRRLIPSLWKYYQAVGIQWVTPGERGDDVDRIIDDYIQALKGLPDISFPFDVKKIKGFRNRRLPCTQIHGDIAIHNVIVSAAGDYLLDWESSTYDYLMRDFYKLLIIDGWRLDRQIFSLMETEMDQQADVDRGTLLPFREQLYWVLFLAIHTMLTTPSYPYRLLKRAQMETNSFLQGW